ncbi:MAG: hypothetical protein FJW36_14725 [Acidobacteria bacterium]|nr:hypothetical protein [Acidobacteriota bacterium]
MLSEALLIAIAIAAEAAGSGQQRPACNAVTRGLMWPVEANGNGKVAIALSKQGALQICTKGPWRYQWTSPVVHIKQLQQSLKHRSED